jgi:hypothetical protein
MSKIIVREEFSAEKQIHDLKGQLSLEFLFVLAVYTIFIFILISSLNSSRFLQNFKEQDFLSNVNLLRILESERRINNGLTDMKLTMAGCILTVQNVSCKSDNYSITDSFPIRNYSTTYYNYLS